MPGLTDPEMERNPVLSSRADHRPRPRRGKGPGEGSQRAASLPLALALGRSVGKGRPLLRRTTLTKKHRKEGVSCFCHRDGAAARCQSRSVWGQAVAPRKRAGQYLDLIAAVALSLFLTSSSSHAACIPLHSLPHPARQLHTDIRPVPGLILLLGVAV